MTIGRQTVGGRVANRGDESEDDEGPHPGGTEATPEVDPDNATEPSADSNPPTGATEPNRAGSDFDSCVAAPTSTFPEVILPGIAVNPPSACRCATPPVGRPCSGVCVIQSDVGLRGEMRGADVSGGGNGPMPLLTLRLSGGSNGAALSFFRELLLAPSLPPAGITADDTDWA